MKSSRPKMSEIERLRHSSAHVLASAILRIWPQAQFAAGPPIENGFYYDLDLDHNISIDDFALIEAEMRKIVKENQRFEKQIVSREEAEKLARAGRLAALDERETPSTFKIDLLNDIPKDEEISLYANGDFLDLCAGDHVMRTGQCKAFKLLSVAATYYKGEAKNPRLQRVYGTAFKNKTQLNEYLEQLEEAKKRDHRLLGKKYRIFHIDEAVGQGLPMWLPNGGIIRRELQNFITELLDEQDYKQVFTPHIGKLDLYRTSGHFPYYAESQFPPILESDVLQKLADEGLSCAQGHSDVAGAKLEGYLLKPMNCPHHIRIYQSEPRSYRDLPLRLAEFGAVYRYEKSGELNGMLRARAFTQDDAHIFCAEDQIEQELLACIGLTQRVLGALGLNDYSARLSLGADASDANAKEKFVGERELWQKAERSLRSAVERIGMQSEDAPGEAAFYGPKIDFVVKDAIGRSWQLGTVQLDFTLPRRFRLGYTSAQNESVTPVMIHRAPFGSLERFVAVLIEHYSGRFPLWLAPEQCRILPISDKFNSYGEEILQVLRKRGIRSSLDKNSEKIGAKIRLAQNEQVPYMLIIGAKELESHSVSVRHRNQGDIGALDLNAFIAKAEEEISLKVI